ASWRSVGVARRSSSLWRINQRSSHPMIRKLIESGLTPSQALNVTVGVNVVGSLAVPIVANPPLVAILAAPPVHECRFTDPGVVIILNHAVVFPVVRRVQRLRIALRKHDDVRIGQGVDR